MVGMVDLGKKLEDIEATFASLHVGLCHITILEFSA